MTFLRALHRWIGLALALVVGAVAVSGGLLLLRDPYYRTAYPLVDAPITASELALRAEVLEHIEQRWQAEGVRLVRFPREGVNAYQVWLGDGTEAFVEPRTGEVIDRWRWSERLPALLFELHAHLLVRPAGEVVNGVIALAIVFMGLTGVVLWWPARRGAFRLRGAFPRRATAGELLRSHAALGTLTVLPLVVFAGTGAALVFYEPAASAMSAWLDARPAELPTARVAPRDAPRQEWPEILRALDDTFPEGEATFYTPAGGDNARVLFRKRLPGEWHPNGRSYVLVDPYTATVVQAIDARAQGAGTRLMYAMYPVHAAKVGGGSMTALAAATAVALGWLAVGGAWTYLKRWSARRAARRGPLAACPRPLPPRSRAAER